MSRAALRFVAAATLALASQAHAHSYNLKGLAIDHPFATPTVSAAPTGAVYLSIANNGRTPDRLLSATTPRAKHVELHSMHMDGDIMRMRQVASIDLPPGKPVVMQPSSGHHLMLVDLAAPLKVGDRFPMTLRFEKAGTLKIEIVVDPPKPAAQDHKH